MSISVLISTNITITYKYVIYRYDISAITGLSAEKLMENYKTIIYYLQNPFTKELELKYFPMSNFGKVHFAEVKQIFIMLYLISIVFILVITVKWIINKSGILDILNKISNILLIILISISIMSVINFSKVFYIFHKIFFRNDYWIFDESTDPVINALPMELFSMELAKVIFLLIIFSLIVKVVYIKKNKRKISE